MDIKILPMENHHWPEAAEIYKQGIECGTATFTTVMPDYSKWDSAHHKFCRFVAVNENGNVMGFIVLSPTYSAPAYCGVAEVSVYVDSAYTRKGVGKALMEHMCKQSPLHNIWTLHSSIIEDNEASINLHYSCGFRMIGYRERIAKDINGVWRNTVLMEKRSPNIY